MNFDKLQICDRCQGDACYVTEVTSEIKSYMCFGCGFQTNSLMKKGEQFFNEQMENLPSLYKELMVEDEEGKIWFPTMINIPDKGMIFADGTRASNFKWTAVKAIKMSEEEKDKFKKLGKDYEYKMDNDNMKHFSGDDFIEAIDFLGVFESENKEL